MLYNTQKKCDVNKLGRWRVKFTLKSFHISLQMGMILELDFTLDALGVLKSSLFGMLHVGNCTLSCLIFCQL